MGDGEGVGVALRQRSFSQHRGEFLMNYRRSAGIMSQKMTQELLK